MNLISMVMTQNKEIAIGVFVVVVIDANGAGTDVFAVLTLSIVIQVHVTGVFHLLSKGS